MKKVFAVYDVKAAAYGTPIFVPNRGLAIRGFTDACLQQGSVLGSHPGDYSLQELGEYDDSCGLLVSHDKPQFVVSAADVVAAGSRVAPIPKMEVPA